MDIKNFSIQEGIGGPRMVVVPVSFENFAQKHEIKFRLFSGGGTWRIANIEYDDGSTLLDILKRDRESQNSQSINIYLVAVGDNGKSGRKIGCEDSLVAVTRTIKKTAAPLTAAIRELLQTPQHPEGSPNLENFWKGRNLKVRSVSMVNGTATIRLSGELSLAGVCDEPRIESQIDATARQFPTVKRVKVFIGNETLSAAIR
jgi:spore germination protein GerM